MPAGYVFLNPSDTAKLETITHNIGGGTEYFLAPQDLHWGAHSFKDDGYVKDDEKMCGGGFGARKNSLLTTTENCPRVVRDFFIVVGA